MGAGFDTLVSIENLIGSKFNDTLTGNGGTNVLNGAAGNDTLHGGLGLAADVLNGGVGIDTASYNGTGPVTVNLNLAGQNTVGAGFDTLVSIENLIGSSFSDTLIGNAGINVLNGDGGADVLTGGGGRDTLLGGLGNDRFDYNSTSESQAGVLNRDVISGFSGNGIFAGDQIDLRDIDANSTFLSIGNQDFNYIGSAGFSNFLGIYTPGQLRYSGGVLQGNTDFDGAAEIEIQLVGSPALFVSSNTLTSDILL